MTKQIGVFLWLAWMSAGFLQAQAPGVAIEPRRSNTSDAALIRQARSLKEAGRLLSLEQVSAQLNGASNAALGLPAPAHRTLKPASIYRLARQSKVRIGWFYLCRKCDHWHFNGSGGYPIASSGILATCYHVVSGEQERSNMREAYLVAADAEGRVSAVTKILAKSRTMDAVILQAPDLRLKPLALNTDVSPGDTVYCYSDPLGLNGFFSQGCVNRFFWNGPSAGARASLDEIKRLRLNVSCAWAPGSSGCAIFDDSGNVVGHVATWGLLQMNEPAIRDDERPSSESDVDGKHKPANKSESTSAPGFHFYEAVPALGVRALAQGPQREPSSRSK